MDIKKAAKIVFVLFTFIYFKNVQSQPDSINKYNEQGKKQGYWVNYLDSSFNLVDKEQAVFYYYAFYNEGECWGIAERPKLESFLLNKVGNNSTTDEIELLDGTYVFKQLQKKWTATITFKKGYIKTWHLAWDDSGNTWEEISYDRKYQGLNSSYYVERQLYKNKIKRGYCYSLSDSKKIKCDLKKYKLEE